MLLNNEWVNDEIKEDIKRYLETNKNENATTTNSWHTGKAILGGKFTHSITGPFQETRKSSNKQTNFTLKELE